MILSYAYGDTVRFWGTLITVTSDRLHRIWGTTGTVSTVSSGIEIYGCTAGSTTGTAEGTWGTVR